MALSPLLGDPATTNDSTAEALLLQRVEQTRAAQEEDERTAQTNRDAALACVAEAEREAALGQTERGTDEARLHDTLHRAARERFLWNHLATRMMLLPSSALFLPSTLLSFITRLRLF
ncbi:hypothetical protein GUJ93_ZPchr0010g7583 [Zizania palustris]|uniref:Uncharacterized protein n=1 Tax=Zizania palustris TaxID=103762 RepID=A0A8J5SZ85_ZIZPA|nr:hypothetical protein GUJ93_ZPchr0010g7583 [Zizania palustris]